MSQRAPQRKSIAQAFYVVLFLLQMKNHFQFICSYIWGRIICFSFSYFFFLFRFIILIRIVKSISSYILFIKCSAHLGVWRGGHVDSIQQRINLEKREVSFCCLL